MGCVYGTIGARVVGRPLDVAVTFAGYAETVMTRELVSKKARHELREHFVNTSLRRIEMAFDAADIQCAMDYDPQVGGQRRTLVEQYYHTLNFTKWADVRKFLAVYQTVLDELEDQTERAFGVEDAYSVRTFAGLRKWIERDGFRYQDGKLTPVHDVRQLDQVVDVAQGFDAPELHRQIERIRTSVETDPRLAIGSAKELVETTCKAILEQRRETFDVRWDLPKLLKETRNVLGLLPEQVDERVKGSAAIRAILGSLGALGQGLAELRNLYGTGHGPGGKPRGLASRHARLAAGSAAVLAAFLLETHEERDQGPESKS